MQSFAAVAADELAGGGATNQHSRPAALVNRLQQWNVVVLGRCEDDDRIRRLIRERLAHAGAEFLARGATVRFPGENYG